MLSTILAENPWLTTAALALLVLAGPLCGAVLVPRRSLTVSLLVVAILAVLLLTLVPTGRVMEVGCHAEISAPRLGAVELIANAVMFVPLTLLAGIWSRRPLTALLWACAGSAAIEIVQAFLPGLGRSCSTNDWVYNTAGAALGAVLAVVAMFLSARRSNREKPNWA